MKYFFTLLSFTFISLFSFSQVITFECDNEVINTSWNDFNNPNAWMDWDGDNLINENDFLIYLADLYECDEWNFINNDEDNDWDWDGEGDDEDNDGGDDFDGNDIFTFECNGEEIVIELTDITDFIDYESYIDAILSDYDCEEWGNEDNDWDWNGEGDDEDNDWDGKEEISWIDVDFGLSDWENFDWDAVWEDLDLGTLVDWDNTPWDQIVEFNILVDDLIDYIISIISGGQPFNWNSFLASQGCYDDDLALQGGLAGLGIYIEGCEDGLVYLLSAGYGCFDAIDIPGLSLEPIMPAEVCCETCGEQALLGCMDATACNYDPSANTDDGSCDYGVECFVSPCSVSEDPGIDGAYCVDDYCEGCCALWYSLDGTLISNSCDNSNDNPAIGIWDDYENNQYIEITDDVIGFYSFLDDEFFMCWYYWSMEYTYVGNGIMEVLDPEYGSVNISSSILENGALQITDPEGEDIVMSPLDELPELDMCNMPTNEGCDDFLGQWSFVVPGTNIELAWLELYDTGAKLYYSENEDSECLSMVVLSYDSLEGSNDCDLFFDSFGIGVPFATASLNDDGTLSIISDDDPNFPDIWTSSNFNSELFDLCDYGCTDEEACNFDINAVEDDGSCEYVLPGECDCDGTLPTIWYMDWDNNGTGNANDGTIESCDQPEGYVNNNDALSIDENYTNNTLIDVKNIMGQKVQNNHKTGLKIYYYNDGTVNKKYVIK